MNITFLLGNGFDRALGLKTGYNAFYEWYCLRPRDNLKTWVADFRNEIDKYIHKSPDAEAYWSDAEYGLGQYTEKFSLETAERFVDCFDDFRDNLVIYLKEQETLVDEELATQMRIHIAPQLVDFFQEIDPLERELVKDLRYRDGAVESRVNFVCFNYTNAVDHVFSALKKESLGQWRGADGGMHKLVAGDLVHAHGTLNMWPIIGVCHPQSIKNTELLKSNLIKVVMQKSESITVTGQLWRTRTKSVINGSQIICVFGMSLGETDSDYWEMLTDWLGANSRHHLVVFWYDTKFNNTNLSIREKYQEINSVRDRFLEFSSWTSEVFDKIKGRIHVVSKPKKMFTIPDECKAVQKTTPQ